MVAAADTMNRQGWLCLLFHYSSDIDRLRVH